MTSPIETMFLRDIRHGGDPAQTARVATELAEFVAAATSSVDVAIYDFRLSEALASVVVPAFTDAAARGVTVRVGFDAGKPASATAQDFATLEADPAPPGTSEWVTEHFAGTKVQVRAIKADLQLMHSKFVVRDAGTVAGAVWTGSTNFTDDAWTLQENNIVTVESSEISAAYRVDFDAMWTTSAIGHTGAGDHGTISLGEAGIGWDFAPGDGPKIDAFLVSLVEGATTRIVLAAMVLTSHTLLSALVGAVGRGIEVSGIYDSGQMDPIVRTWRTNPRDTAVVAHWTTVSELLAAKPSTPYSPTSVHDFMHNKILICDDTVATGSYNFSANAEHNAENQLRISDPDIAGRFVEYITEIANAYHSD